LLPNFIDAVVDLYTDARFDNLATEENEEADLIQEPIKVTIPTFQCEECDKTFSKKTGLSQHERFRHHYQHFPLH
jgi:hypothetical protein